MLSDYISSREAGREKKHCYHHYWSTVALAGATLMILIEWCMQHATG